jgi:methylglutaconyl-CoA hydratase
MGLAHRAVPAAQLHQAGQEVIDMLKLGGPIAAAECKRLVRRVQQVSVTEGFIEMAGWSRRMFLSAEAAEGMAAFREKRPPAWVSTEGRS